MPLTSEWSGSLKMNVKRYYPVFLDLEHKRCLVVGGGAMAERKVQGLLAAKTDVVVVSPSLTNALRRWATAGAIHHLSRTFGDADVKGCALVIAATDRVEVNARVATAARRRGVWVNVVDTPAACDFIAPSVVRHGELQIAISTGGNSPTMAKRLRNTLEQLIGPEYGALVDVLGRLRAAMRRRGEPPDVRQAMFEGLVEASGLPLVAATPFSDQHGGSPHHAGCRPRRVWTENAPMAENAVGTSAVTSRNCPTQQTRRNFLTVSTTGTLALLLAGLPRGWVGGAYAGDGPETPKVRIGIIALTDCSSIVMAHELGLFKKYGIESIISKEASWAVIRDRLSLGENQATHLLLGMPYASTMGLLGSPVTPMIIPFYLNRNGQAITLTKDLLAKGVKTPQVLKPLAEESKRAGKPMTFAMTFPPGTHAMWMRYWLAAGGINPDKDVTLITIPPPQMVANMKVGKMDGFCVGEPWNARAIADGIGFTAITTQQIWRDHPEKVLGLTEEFAEKHPRTVKALLRALLEASQYIDKLENRPHVAEVVARPQYINTQKEVILGRLLGQYDYGDERPAEQDPYYMTFFDRHTNFPWKSHGIWWLSQFRRWGMAKEEVDYTGLVNRVHRPDIFREVAKDMGIDPPEEDMKKETLFDGVEFDPAQPEQYVRLFAVHNLT
jgi:nitrate/nitrite transport system substrate-binding protein